MHALHNHRTPGNGEPTGQLVSMLAEQAVSGPVLLTVVVSAKSLTPWALVGTAVAAPVRLEVDDLATPQDRSILPVER